MGEIFSDPGREGGKAVPVMMSFDVHSHFFLEKKTFPRGEENFKVDRPLARREENLSSSSSLYIFLFFS